MKKVILIIVLVLPLWAVSQTDSKEVKFVSGSAYSGQGPLSSGPVLEANFSRENDMISIMLGEQDLYVAYFKSILKDKFSIAPCLEYYHNVPTLGVMAPTNFIKHISTLSWIGYSAGTPDQKVELTNWKFLFFWQSIDLTFGRFTATGAILHFKNWQQVVNLNYTQPLNKNFSIFTGAGYNFDGEGMALLKIGITYKR